MTSKQFRRAAAVIFTFASVGFLLETMAEKDGPLVEILFGFLLATLGAAWLAWEFLAKPQT